MSTSYGTMCVAALALVALACSKQDDATPDTTAAAAATPATATTPEAKWAGTWRGRYFVAANDTGMPFTVVANMDGSSMSFDASGDTARYRPISLTDTSIVSESAPTMSKALKMEVVWHVEGRMTPDSAYGTAEARPTKAGEQPTTARWSMRKTSP